MTPTDQTKFGPTEGNCMSACLAAMLEIPIEDVQCEETDNWFKDVNDWLQDNHQLAMMEVSTIPYWYRGYFIVCGKSPRGIEHACIGHVKEGRVAVLHDPHPSRDGLLNIDEVYALVKAD